MRLSHLTALAVMIALVGAMFAVMVSAQTAVAPKAPVFGDGEGANTTLEQDGDTVGSLVFSWAAVTENTDGKTLAGLTPATPITDYDVEYRRSGTTTWMDHVTDAGEAPAASAAVSRNFTIGSDEDANTTNLIQDTEYEFRVRAQVGAGETAVEGAWSEIMTGTTGQNEALGACSTSQTLELDAPDGVERDDDEDGENCTVTLESSVIGDAANVRVTRTGGKAGVVTFGAINTSGTNTGVVTFTVARTAEAGSTATYDVSINEGGTLSQTVSYTFTAAYYGEGGEAATTTTAAPTTAEVGDVSANYGFCAASKVLVTEQGGSTKITVAVPDGDDDGSALDLMNIACSKDDLHKPFTISPNGTEEPTVTEAKPSVLLLLSDEDGTVPDGSDLVVHALFSNWETANSVANVDMTSTSGLVIDWVRVSGVFTGDRNDKDRIVDFTDLAAISLDYPDRGRAFELNVHTVTIPEGTPEGEYTISARIIWDTDDAGDQRGMNSDGTDNDDEIRVVSRKFTVGDAGDTVGSVKLALGNQKEDNPLTTVNERKAESGAAPAEGGDIWLKASVMTSIDGATNKPDIKSITFIAPGAELEVYDDGTFSGGLLVDSKGDLRGAGNGAAAPDMVGKGTNSVQITGGKVEHTGWVKVTKDDEEPGMVDIYALVVGDGASATSETVTLTFTGSGTVLVLGDAAPATVGEMTEFSVSAEDANGNEAKINQLAFTVADADGEAVSGTHVKVTQGNTGDSTEKASDDDPNEIAGIVTIGPKAEPGVYTITVSLAGVAASATTTEITVTGKAANVELEASATEVELNDIVTATATITDKSGALVADGTKVTWGTFGALKLTLIGGAEETKDGEAKASFGVSSGSGGAQITAISGDGVGSIAVSAVAEEDAMPEEASVSCLSELSGFATWSCGVEADASEIFDMVSGRGVTALHLWNGSTWVRYSVVDGTMVPGSSDFMVTESDILYISN